ncbi:AP-4 complex subunit epsilon-1 [Procambarus clarkii]|uniref:AP-4 complex subunit epsilon-1 n=1 Tax=Procambarus clarkii TaxID=6728 RepID=UPI001E673A5C|nr:AP-4 complex subunit epsilon-1-like [Procambarus clarkii]XP_045622375.1 AP-4 complex subunit epsilon-1-like [Procambarus clarkii]XP_045622376.1 AP-4 complex subunit epsilon-1-like [Procambarus clarkii]XP_045622377.1 AP-4 complex subunit epsilon-1-like [Procambarus clarkii]XP_045622378.1 AP-4 complex subunit epsilon-1-like [Procambarus clarkii]XP_045622379.1 AP-4 complex subunit epsilon-1-like [Procambarus clarkii]
MSNVLEKTFSGLVHSFLGTSGGSNTLAQSVSGVSGLKNVSLGLVHFVEKLEAARRISKQEEEHCVGYESREWVKLLSSPGVGSSVVADLLCRALLVHVRGYSLPSLHIHAIKLTQSPNVLHKKIGYLFVSQTVDPGSELTLLLVNTIHRDLAAANALQVAASLASLPTVVTPDLTPAIITALTHCLAHQQVYLRRRAAVMVGVVAERCGKDLQETASDQVPHLLHLLTDQDPGVALAAISSLCKIYKSCGYEKTELRDQVAKSASHLLTQALNGALPRDYQVNSLPAPFVQIQMLRVLRCLSSKDWQVPSDVTQAIELVLSQPWGGREISLYAVLLECVFTVTALPHNDTLISRILKVVLGFLSSSNVDLKYVGLKALASVFSVLEEALTPSHLEAVLDCLYHSNANLQAKTLKLLCTMANSHNYQAVCTTLLEFSGRTQDVTTHNTIVGELAAIVTKHCQDTLWCVELISPIILSSPTPDKRLTDALVLVLEQGFREEKNIKASTEASQELLLKIFSHTSLSEAYISLIASILNLHYVRDPKQVSKYFTDSFLEKLKLMRNLKEDDSAIFQCLKNIGLNDKTVCADIVSFLQPYTVTGNIDLALKEKSNEICKWLTNPQLSIRVIKRQEDILNHKVNVDLTLSFLDSYVVASLESGAIPFKPFSVVLEEKIPSDVHEPHWNANVSLGSDDGRSSTHSIGTGLTSGTSQSGNYLNRSMTAPSKRVWSTEGRIRQKSEGEESIRSRVDSSSQPVGLQGTLLGNEDEEEDEVTEGSVELADEAQEDEEEKVLETSHNQRSQLTHALLAGLGMTRTK